MTEYLLARRNEINLLYALIKQFPHLYVFEDGPDSASLWTKDERDTREVWKLFYNLKEKE